MCEFGYIELWNSLRGSDLASSKNTKIIILIKSRSVSIWIETTEKLHTNVGMENLGGNKRALVGRLLINLDTMM